MSGAPFQYRTLNTGYAGFSARGSDQSAQQFGFRSHDADFFIRDLDTLGQRAEVVAAVAAAVQPDALASRAGEGLDHIGADSLIAGMVERGLDSLGVRAGLFPNRLEAGDTLLQAGGVEIGDAGLDGVEWPVEALVGLDDALVQFGQVLAAALGALLASVEDAGEDGFQPLGLKQAIFQVARDELIEPVHRDRAALAAGLALPGLGRAGVVAIDAACATLASSERHRASAFGAEADAGKEGRAAGDARRRHPGITGLEPGLHHVEGLPVDQRRTDHDRHLVLGFFLPILVGASVEPVLANIGRAGQDGVNLRQPPAPAVTGEDAAFVEIAGDGLDAHRSLRAVAFEEQAVNQPHRFGVERVDLQLLLGLRSPLLSRDDAIADRRQGTVPEALTGVLVHRPQDVLGVFLGLVFVEERHDLPHHDVHGIVAHLLGDGDELDAVLGELPNVKLQLEMVTEETGEAVDHDNIEGRGLGRPRLDHALELGAAVVGGGRARFDEGLDQLVAA